MLQLYVERIPHNGHIVVRWWQNSPVCGEYLERRVFIGYTLKSAIDATLDRLGVALKDAEICFDKP